MSDTSLVFDVLARDRSSTTLAKIAGAAMTTGEAIKRALNQRGGGQLATDIESVRGKLRELATEYDRTGNKDILKDMSRQRSELKRLENAASELASGGLDNARNSLESFGSGLTSIVSNVWTLIPALTAIGAAATAAIPAVSLLGGALGSLPALAVGGAAVVGALGLGFMGLADAFKKTTVAGGALVDKAYQVAHAERQVADAQKAALDAQQAITRAREDAAKKNADLARSIAGAHLDEEAAIFAVEDAQKNLNTVLSNPGHTADDVARADLAYRQSVQTLDDLRSRLGDMEQQQRQAAAAGIDGSDEVKSALDRQRKATEALADAQHALKEAQKPAAGGGAAAEAMKLAPAAMAAVSAVKSLAGAFESLRLDVQQRLFAGASTEIRLLAKAWLPQLHTSLGGMADTFNGLFKVLSRSVREPEFITKIGRGIESVRGAIDTVGKAVAGPLVDAFGRLAGAAGPFITAFGTEVAKVVEDFSGWIQKADKSGSLTSFFDRASAFLHDVFGIGRNVVAIIGDVVSALFSDPKNGGGGSSWEKLKKSLDDLRAWFDNPSNQKKIQDWFQKLETYGKVLLDVAGWLAGLLLWLDKAEHALERWGAKAAATALAVGHAFRDAWDDTVKFVSDLPGRIGRAAVGMWDGIKYSFRDSLNWIIARWNGLHFTIGGGSFMGISLPVTTLGTPNIPYLDTGGDVLRSGLAVIHAGERVTPVAQVRALPTQQRAVGPAAMTVKFAGNTDSAFATAFMRLVREGTIQIAAA